MLVSIKTTAISSHADKGIARCCNCHEQISCVQNLNANNWKQKHRKKDH